MKTMFSSRVEFVGYYNYNNWAIVGNIVYERCGSRIGLVSFKSNETIEVTYYERIS